MREIYKRQSQKATIKFFGRKNSNKKMVCEIYLNCRQKIYIYIYNYIHGYKNNVTINYHILWKISLFIISILNKNIYYIIVCLTKTNFNILYYYTKYSTYSVKLRAVVEDIQWCICCTPSGFFFCSPIYHLFIK